MSPTIEPQIPPESSKIGDLMGFLKRLEEKGAIEQIRTGTLYQICYPDGLKGAQIKMIQQYLYEHHQLYVEITKIKGKETMYYIHVRGVQFQKPHLILAFVSGVVLSLLATHFWPHQKNHPDTAPLTLVANKVLPAEVVVDTFHEEFLCEVVGLEGQVDRLSEQVRQLLADQKKMKQDNKSLVDIECETDARLSTIEGWCDFLDARRRGMERDIGDMNFRLLRHYGSTLSTHPDLMTEDFLALFWKSMQNGNLQLPPKKL